MLLQVFGLNQQVKTLEFGIYLALQYPEKQC